MLRFKNVGLNIIKKFVLGFNKIGPTLAIVVTFSEWIVVVDAGLDCALSLMCAKTKSIEIAIVAIRFLSASIVFFCGITSLVLKKRWFFKCEITNWICTTIYIIAKGNLAGILISGSVLRNRYYLRFK